MEQTLLWILGSSLLVSLMSLVGVLTLSMKKKLMDKLVFMMVAFAAGALLGGAFFHLVPEALEEGDIDAVFVALLSGFIMFFILERVLRWRHCHEGACNIHAFTYLNLVGDGLHNLIDGMVIAAAYITDMQLGMVTTFAVIAHEVPQEIGDFAVLVYGGFNKIKALVYNLLSALTAIVGAIIGYFFLKQVGGFASLLLALTAGGFIYVSSSDLIPELHKEPDMKKSMMSFFLFLAGIGLMYVTKILFEG